MYLCFFRQPKTKRCLTPFTFTPLTPSLEYIQYRTKNIAGIDCSWSGLYPNVFEQRGGLTKLLPSDITRIGVTHEYVLKRYHRGYLTKVWGKRYGLGSKMMFLVLQCQIWILSAIQNPGKRFSTR